MAQKIVRHKLGMVEIQISFIANMKADFIRFEKLPHIERFIYTHTIKQPYGSKSSTVQESEYSSIQAIQLVLLYAIPSGTRHYTEE